MCFKGSKNQQSWLPFGNSSQKGGVFMHVDRGRFFVFVDRGRFRLYLGDSWCIHFFWLMMYLFLWDVYVRGRYFVLCYLFIIISFIVSCLTYATLIIDLYYEVIHDICLLFSILWNQKFIFFLLVFSTHAFLCLLSISGVYRLI